MYYNYIQRISQNEKSVIFFLFKIISLKSTLSKKRIKSILNKNRTNSLQFWDLYDSVSFVYYLSKSG